MEGQEDCLHKKDFEFNLKLMRQAMAGSEVVAV